MLFQARPVSKLIIPTPKTAVLTNHMGTVHLDGRLADRSQIGRLAGWHVGGWCCLWLGRKSAQTIMPRNATWPFRDSYENITTTIHVTMIDRSEIIEKNPIGRGLGDFRASFNSICEGRAISPTPDALYLFDKEGLVIRFAAVVLH